MTGDPSSKEAVSDLTSFVINSMDMENTLQLVLGTRYASISRYPAGIASAAQIKTRTDFRKKMFFKKILHFIFS